MKKTNYESAVARIEEIVRILEKGEAPLDESLKMFEEATKLVSTCSNQLENAKIAVARLRKGPDDAPIEEPFERMGELDD